MDKHKVTLELDLETASALSVILTSALAKYHDCGDVMDGTIMTDCPTKLEFG